MNQRVDFILVLNVVINGEKDKILYSFKIVTVIIINNEFISLFYHHL